MTCPDAKPRESPFAMVHVLNQQRMPMRQKFRLEKDINNLKNTKRCTINRAGESCCKTKVANLSPKPWLKDSKLMTNEKLCDVRKSCPEVLHQTNTHLHDIVMARP